MYSGEKPWGQSQANPYGKQQPSQSSPLFSFTNNEFSNSTGGSVGATITGGMNFHNNTTPVSNPGSSPGVPYGYGNYGASNSSQNRTPVPNDAYSQARSPYPSSSGFAERVPLDLSYTGRDSSSAATSYQSSPGINRTDSLNSATDYDYQPEEVRRSSFPSTGTIKIDMRNEATGKWDGVVATKDTGTKQNWIDQSLVNRFELTVTEGLNQEHTTFNGQTLNSFQTVQITWTLVDGARSYRTEFRVVPAEAKTPFQVLFGRNFLHRYPDLLGKRNQQAEPVAVLVQESATCDERKLSEGNKKKADEKAAKLRDERRRESSSREAGSSRDYRPHRSSTHKGKDGDRSKRESKRDSCS
ncbi:hypothetical protein B0J14DRAFT_250994 [Halenospora varia]|nr:hypothetical protein B0J14DRAFT_250994 [Halenospora varia]